MGLATTVRMDYNQVLNQRMQVNPITIPEAVMEDDSRVPRNLKEITYPSSSDNTEQPALFYSPTGSGKRPLLVGLHEWSGTYHNCSCTPYADWCLDRGWTFIYPDFRGPANRPEATGSELVVGDIVSAVAFAKAHADVDETRIYLIGASGGGYHALLMAGRAPEIWAGVSAWVPIASLRDWYFESLARKSRYAEDVAGSCGGVPEEGSSAFAECEKRSPMTWLCRARGVQMDINAGIEDGHTGSVPVNHALRAFNMLACSGSRIPEKHIRSIVKTARVPSQLRFRGGDPLFGEKRVLFRRRSSNARVTLFAGGHEIIAEAGLSWLEQQKQGHAIRGRHRSPLRSR